MASSIRAACHVSRPMRLPCQAYKESPAPHVGTLASIRDKARVDSYFIMAGTKVMMDGNQVNTTRATSRVTRYGNTFTVT